MLIQSIGSEPRETSDPPDPSGFNQELRQQFDNLMAVVYENQEPGTTDERLRWESVCIKDAIVARLDSFAPLNNGVEAGGQIIKGITEFIDGLGGYAAPEISVSLTPLNRTVHRARLVPSRRTKTTIMLTLLPIYAPDHIRLKIVHPDDL